MKSLPFRMMIFIFAPFLMAASISAQARPEYARKEGRACLFCHESGTPGGRNAASGAREPTTRNERGLYYGSHNHTFEGYVEKQLVNLKALPIFKFSWGEELPDKPKRMAVADVVGDGDMRLITLNENPDDPKSSRLQIRKWKDKAFITEFTAEVKSPPDKMEVGKFAGSGKPAVIVTQSAVWHWNGVSFVSIPLKRTLPLLGVKRHKDGSEEIIMVESLTEVKSYRVDLEAQGDASIVASKVEPISTPVIWWDMHADPDIFEKMGMSKTHSAGGLIGVWEVRRGGTLFVYHAKVDRDFDVAPDPANKSKPKITYKDASYYVSFRDQASDGEIWATPKLVGKVYDIAIADPKSSGKPGFAVLSTEIGKGKGRALYFFTLD